MFPVTKYEHFKRQHVEHDSHLITSKGDGCSRNVNVGYGLVKSAWPQEGRRDRTRRKKFVVLLDHHRPHRANSDGTRVWTGDRRKLGLDLY